VKHISRRVFLHSLAAMGSGLLAACQASPTPTTAALSLVPSATLPNTPTRIPTATSIAATLSPTKTSLPTDAPAATVPPTQTPLPTPTAVNPIRHVVVFIQENHTFDSMFAGFPGANSHAAVNNCHDALSADPPHQHEDALRPNGATSAEANCSYTEAQEPNYWKIARAFTLCDNFFSDVRGPSHPNYLMMMAAQSPILNTPRIDLCPDFCLDIPTVPQRLDTRGLTWRDYGGLFTDIKGLDGRSEVINDPNADLLFFRDAQQGTLPDVAWLNSDFLNDGDNKSGHPIGSLCAAENYAVKVLTAVMNGPQWNSTAVFLFMDDWGGFYDHVAPPIVERAADGTPFRYGFRVPCIVISPYARSGYVSHQLTSFVSVDRFIETMFGLVPLTFRDAQANPMLDCFDFNQKPLPPLPLTLRECP
jgi:phospholipase C